VHRETTVLGRRVFLDYRRDLGGGRLDKFRFESMSDEAREYLRRSGGIRPTPSSG